MPGSGWPGRLEEDYVVRTLSASSIAVRLMLWLTICAPSAQAATEPALESFEAGKRAFADADYGAALAHFELARDAGLEGPAIHYNLGVCHFKLGDYPSAEAAFRHIANAYPAMRGLAQYNLGLVALRLGQDVQAQSLFRQALANSEDDTVRRLAQSQLPVETATRADDESWLTLIDTRVGHDDNVLLLAEEIPLASGQSAASPFTQLFALVSGPLTSRADLRFDGSGYAVRYHEDSRFDQTALRLGLRYLWSLGLWRGEVGPHYGYSTLDGDVFERRISVGLRLARDIAARATLGVRYEHDVVTEGDARFAFIDGSRDRLELRVARRSGSGLFALAYALEWNDRDDPSVSPKRNELSVRYRHDFGGRWSADVEVSTRDSRYRDLVVERQEELVDLSLGLTRSLGRGWQANGVLSLADNESDIELVRYDRRRIALGVSKGF